ncbi:hypothetical protein NQZ68_022643, partial [Dissostichus eleginoides]
SPPLLPPARPIGILGQRDSAGPPGTPPALTPAPPPGEHLWIDPGPAGTRGEGQD